MTLWNMARAASKRPLPKPRKMHAPVGEKLWSDRGTHKFDDRGEPGACTALGRVTEEPAECNYCGYPECSCDRIFELHQEKQRAALALRPEEVRGSMRPVVRHYLRHGDPRRMSLGYNERDYDRSRELTLAEMQAELRAIRGEYVPKLEADLAAGMSLADIKAKYASVDQRAQTLQTAILEHQRKLPRMPESHQVGDGTPK